jgi:hypothetical protein
MSLTQLFTVLLQSDGGAASAAFNSVPGFRTKLDMVRAAAAVRLKDTPALLEKCLRLCDRLEKKSKKRNQIVHFTLYQDAIGWLGTEKPSPDELAKLVSQIDWYLSPTAFDGAYFWRHGQNPPRLRAVDISNRVSSFDRAHKELWDLSAEIADQLKRPPASP